MVWYNKPRFIKPPVARALRGPVPEYISRLRGLTDILESSTIAPTPEPPTPEPEPVTEGAFMSTTSIVPSQTTGSGPDEVLVGAILVDTSTGTFTMYALIGASGSSTPTATLTARNAAGASLGTSITTSAALASVGPQTVTIASAPMYVYFYLNSSDYLDSWYCESISLVHTS